MSGYETFKKAGEELKREVAEEKKVGPGPLPFGNDEEVDSTPAKEETNVARIEHHNELAERGSIGITGLEDIDGSWLPVPYMQLVQLTTTTAKLDSGKDAPRGSFFMKDTREVLDEPIRFILLRAKTGSYVPPGEIESSPTMNLLGLLLPDMRPFILSLTSGSFGTVKSLFGDLKRRKSERAWYYGITMTHDRGVNKSQQPYFFAKFEVDKELQDEAAIKVLDSMFDDYAASLDRRDEVEVS